MNAQILVNFGKNWFEFTKSRTGQLDFAGKVDAQNVNVEGFQKLSGSTYFSPSYYIFFGRRAERNVGDFCCAWN